MKGRKATVSSLTFEVARQRHLPAIPHRPARLDTRKSECISDAMSIAGEGLAVPRPDPDSSRDGSRASASVAQSHPPPVRPVTGHPSVERHVAAVAAAPVLSQEARIAELEAANASLARIATAALGLLRSRKQVGATLDTIWVHEHDTEVYSDYLKRSLKRRVVTSPASGGAWALVKVSHDKASDRYQPSRDID